MLPCKHITIFYENIYSCDVCVKEKKKKNKKTYNIFCTPRTYEQPRAKEREGGRLKSKIVCVNFFNTNFVYFKKNKKRTYFYHIIYIYRRINLF